MQSITSKDNARLKALRLLVRSKKERQKRSSFVIEGTRALGSLADGGGLPEYCLKEIWVSADHAELASALDLPVYCVPDELIQQVSDCRSSQGILGVVEHRPLPLEISPERGRYLLLDRVMDPGNMGTLIRSAVAFGFSGVLLYGDCVEVFNPKTVRSTMGTLPFCSVRQVGDEVFSALETLGYELISTAMTGGENLHAMEFSEKTVLVIGNEANGVSEAVRRRAARFLSIPMPGRAESLNAGVAGSICMFAMSG